MTKQDKLNYFKSNLWGAARSLKHAEECVSQARRNYNTMLEFYINDKDLKSLVTEEFNKIEIAMGWVKS